MSYRTRVHHVQLHFDFVEFISRRSRRPPFLNFHAFYRKISDSSFGFMGGKLSTGVACLPPEKNPILRLLTNKKLSAPFSV